jgi:hypothetical protein
VKCDQKNLCNGQCPHQDSQQKILGKKNPRIRKTKITHQSLQLHLSLIYLHCTTNIDGDIVRESFSVKFILHSLWYTPLVYVFMNFFFQCGLLCMFLVDFVFSQPDVNITWITGYNCWNHPPVPSITPLFNLLALHNKHLYLKSVYLS